MDATHKLLSKLGFLEERVQYAEITGIWESHTYGLTQLQHEGNRVAGTYGPYTRQQVGLVYGALKGEIKGERLDFTWCQDTSKEVPCENRKWQGDGYFFFPTMSNLWRENGVLKMKRNGMPRGV